MKTWVTTISLVVAALLCMQPASATVARQYCVNDSVEAVSATFSISGNGTVVDYYQEHICNNGCSGAISQCRPERLYEMLYISLFVAGVCAYSMFGRWVSKNTDSDMDVPILMLGMFFAIMIAALDMFNTVYRTIILGSAFIPIFILYLSRREMPDEEEEVE